MARWLKLSAGLLLALATVANATPQTDQRAAFAAHICAEVKTQAEASGLDPAFFARLLWRESLFDPNVTSDKGAQGIAQFMPETACRRGLANPYEPEAAVKASAGYLADLKKQFGNIGLAAAAYNAGEQRLANWLAGKGGLPEETRAYVAFVTGHEPEDWKAPTADFPVPALGPAPDFASQCEALAQRKQQLAEPGIASAPHAPWGALLVANFSEARALAKFRRLKLRFPQSLANRDPLILRHRNLSRGRKRMVYVMIGEASRAAAAKTCTNLTAVGAPCLVRKN